MEFEYIPMTQDKISFDYYIDSFDNFYCFVKKFNAIRVNWSQPTSLSPSYFLRLLINGSSEKAQGYKKGYHNEDDEHSMKLVPYYLGLLDHGAMWKLKNGNVVCTAMPYGDRSSILAKFNRMRQEFNYPDSIRLEFLSDQYFFRSAGDCMILIYYDSSQEAFIPCCSNTELRIKAIQHSAPGIMRYRATSSSFVRDKYVSEYTKRRAQGVCQLCDQPAPFCDPNGIPYLETHHVIWLADGGPDSIENTVAICPNCHRKMHILNLDEDVQKLILLAANTDWC